MSHPTLKGRSQSLTADQVIAAIQQSKGNVSAAARSLDVSRKTIINYADRYSTVKQALDDEREAMIDTAESALHAAILDKQGWAVCFTLKTLGKSRGYVERQEITGADGRAIEIRHADELTDDELARIAASSSGGTTEAT